MQAPPALEFRASGDPSQAWSRREAAEVLDQGLDALQAFERGFGLAADDQAVVGADAHGLAVLGDVADQALGAGKAVVVEGKQHALGPGLDLGHTRPAAE